MEKSKNHFKVIKKGKIIELEITASSEEMAEKMFDAIEFLGVEVLRFDLAQEWQNNENENVD